MELSPTNKLVFAGAAVLVAYLAYKQLFAQRAPPPSRVFGITLPAEKPGESEIHRSPLASKELISKLNGAETLYDNFNLACQKYGNRPLLGSRVNNSPYTWETYDQVKKRVLNIGSALNTNGYVPKSTVGIFSVNRSEWTITDLACQAYSLISVPLYDTLGADSIEHIIKLSEIKIVFCTKDKIKALIEVVPKLDGILKEVVVFDGCETSEIESLKNSGLSYFSFKDYEKIGEQKPVKVIPPSPSDLTTICFTSGTTGLPKGAMLSHGNLLADAAGALASGVIVITPDDSHLSYLPLAHVFERLVQICIISGGASIGFFRGDVRVHLFEDIAELKPTIFASVPRLFNRIFDKVMQQINSSPNWKKTMFQMAFNAKKANLAHGEYTHPVWDALVFKKVKNLLGGRVRYMITGSAPLSGEVLEFLRICFCCAVAEGYGQTECSAAATASVAGYPTVNNVGIPLPCAEVKLVDVPEMNYTTKSQPFPAGEVCFRGPCVFSGYYRDEAKTKEALDEDGWLHSGDIGCWLADGTLRIIDRKKNIFKLSHGEYIAPEKIENINVSCPFVAQSFVHGSSLKSSVVAVVVPDPDVVKKWAQENNISGTFEELCKTKELKKAIIDDLARVGKAAKLKGFEFIKDVHLDPEPFSPEKDILTPTFKMKRPQASAYYKAQIDEMYSRLD